MDALSIRNPQSAIRNCFSRRDFLQMTGGLALSSLSGWLDPLARGAAAAGAKHKSCIVLWLAGGVSQLETFDLKPGVSYFEPIQTTVPGIQVCQHLPKFAQLMQHAAILRGMCTLENDHFRATYMTHTGLRPVAGGAIFPSLGSIASMELGKPAFPLPNYVIVRVDNSSFNSSGRGSGFLGPQHQPLVIADPKRGVENLKPLGDMKQFDDRTNLLNQLEQGFYQQRPTAAQAHLTTLQRAAQMMHSKESAAYDLSLEPAAARDAYGSSGYGQGCLMARRLVEVGVPFVEVDLPNWDDHKGHEFHTKNLPPFDTALSALVTDLKDRGMLESTLVVVMGEFGRGGTILKPGAAPGGSDRSENRGHWHKAWSTVLIGGGIKAGQVIGKTDEIAATVEDRPVSIKDFLATLCLLLGIDYTKETKDPGGRPIRLVEKGERPIQELIG